MDIYDKKKCFACPFIHYFHVGHVPAISGFFFLLFQDSNQMLRLFYSKLLHSKFIIKRS